MTRFVAFLALFGYCCSAAAQTSTTTQTFALAKPLVEIWRKCAMDKALIFARSGEAAETVAKVSLYECRDQRQTVAETLFRAEPAKALSAIDKIESDIRDFLVSLIVQGKSQRP